MVSVGGNCTACRTHAPLRSGRPRTGRGNPDLRRQHAHRLSRAARRKRLDRPLRKSSLSAALTARRSRHQARRRSRCSLEPRFAKIERNSPAAAPGRRLPGSRGRAIGYASMPTWCPNTSGQSPTSNPRITATLRWRGRPPKKTRLDYRPRHDQRRQSGLAASDRPALHHRCAEVGPQEVRLLNWPARTAGARSGKASRSSWRGTGDR